MLRQDRWGKRASSANFSYHTAYKTAAALRPDTMPLFDLATFIADAGKNAEMLWPHPPWEQHAMFAKAVALLLAGSAECAESESAAAAIAAAAAGGGGGGADILCSFKNSSAYSAPLATPAQQRSSTCDGNADGALMTAVWVSNMEKNGKKKYNGGWNVRPLQYADNDGGEGGRGGGDHSTNTNSGAASAKTTEVPGQGATADMDRNRTEWRLYEDRPGKPGWISESAGSTIEVSLSRWNAPWMAFGLRPLLFEVSFMMTYGDAAATWEVEYCKQHIARIATKWDDNVSLLKVASFTLPPCRQLELFGKVVVRHAADSPGKVKLTSFALCAQ